MNGSFLVISSIVGNVRALQNGEGVKSQQSCDTPWRGSATMACHCLLELSSLQKLGGLP